MICVVRLLKVESSEITKDPILDLNMVLNALNDEMMELWEREKDVCKKLRSCEGDSDLLIAEMDFCSGKIDGLKEKIGIIQNDKYRREQFRAEMTLILEDFFVDKARRIGYDYGYGDNTEEHF